MAISYVSVSCWVKKWLFMVFVRLFKSHIQIVVWYFKGLLWTFFSVHVCVILGDVCYFIIFLSMPYFWRDSLLYIYLKTWQHSCKISFFCNWHHNPVQIISGKYWDPANMTYIPPGRLGGSWQHYKMILTTPFVSCQSCYIGLVFVAIQTTYLTYYSRTSLKGHLDSKVTSQIMSPVSNLFG